MNGLYSRIIMAFRGRCRWMYYKRKYGVASSTTRYIIFPEQNSAYNNCVIDMMDRFVREKHYDHLIVVSSDKSVYRFFDSYTTVYVDNLRITLKQMKCLMYYAALVDRSRDWTIVSVKTPYDTGAERLLGINSVDIKDIVEYDILRFGE